MFWKKILEFKWFVLAGVVVLLLIGGGGIYLFSMNRAEELESPTAVIEVFAAPVFVQENKKEKIEVKAKREVVEGASVSTGKTGRAQIIYPNKSVTRIDFNSVITIGTLTESPSTIEVDLFKGRIWSRVAKLLGREVYQTKSPTVVATVRGTSYGHGILADGRNKVSSTKNTVEARCFNNIQEALVETGLKFFLDCESEDSETEPLDATDEDEWFKFNEKQDEILDRRFGEKTYDDQRKSVTLSPTRAPTRLPVRASATPTPTPTPAATDAPDPTATHTPAPTATPSPRVEPTEEIVPTNTPDPEQQIN